MDDEANCIWGARIDEEMKGRIRVMTIVTGVQSPFILGKTIDTGGKRSGTERARRLSNDLGIDFLR